ncbi:unnamed protein product [Phaeothamnion confervicola]
MRTEASNEGEAAPVPGAADASHAATEAPAAPVSGPPPVPAVDAIPSLSMLAAAAVKGTDTAGSEPADDNASMADVISPRIHSGAAAARAPAAFTNSALSMSPEGGFGGFGGTHGFGGGSGGRSGAGSVSMGSLNSAVAWPEDDGGYEETKGGNGDGGGGASSGAAEGYEETKGQSSEYNPPFPMAPSAGALGFAAGVQAAPASLASGSMDDFDTVAASAAYRENAFSAGPTSSGPGGASSGWGGSNGGGGGGGLGGGGTWDGLGEMGAAAAAAAGPAGASFFGGSGKGPAAKRHHADIGNARSGIGGDGNVSDDEVIILMELGFGRDEALRALRLHDNDVSRAADHLLGGGGGTVTWGPAPFPGAGSGGWGGGAGWRRPGPHELDGIRVTGSDGLGCGASSGGGFDADRDDLVTHINETPSLDDMMLDDESPADMATAAAAAAEGAAVAEDDITNPDGGSGWSSALAPRQQCTSPAAAAGGTGKWGDDGGSKACGGGYGGDGGGGGGGSSSSGGGSPIRDGEYQLTLHRCYSTDVGAEAPGSWVSVKVFTVGSDQPPRPDGDRLDLRIVVEPLEPTEAARAAVATGLAAAEAAAAAKAAKAVAAAAAAAAGAAGAVAGAAAGATDAAGKAAAADGSPLVPAVEAAAAEAEADARLVEYVLDVHHNAHFSPMVLHFQQLGFVTSAKDAVERTETCWKLIRPGSRGTAAYEIGVAEHVVAESYPRSATGLGAREVAAAEAAARSTAAAAVDAAATRGAESGGGSSGFGGGGGGLGGTGGMADVPQLMAPDSLPLPPPLGSREWQCPQCTLLNDELAMFCNACDGARPGSFNGNNGLGTAHTFGSGGSDGCGKNDFRPTCTCADFQMGGLCKHMPLAATAGLPGVYPGKMPLDAVTSGYRDPRKMPPPAAAALDGSSSGVGGGMVAAEMGPAAAAEGMTAGAGRVAPPAATAAVAAGKDEEAKADATGLS